MIARNEPVFALHPHTIGGAALVSLALCLLLPLVALACWLGGTVAWAVLWVVIGVLFALFYVMLVGGVIAGVGGVFAALGGANDDERGAGCGAIVGGVIVAYLGNMGATWWGTTYADVRASGVRAYEFCSRNAEALISDVWIGRGVVWLVWLVLVLALLVALGTLVTILVLRARDRARGPLASVWFACPFGHRAGVAFGCPECGAFDDALRPSVFGVFRAACACGRELPVCDWIGRAELPKRCRSCEHQIEHPECGTRAERHILVWDPDAPPGAPALLAESVEALEAAGADARPEAVPTNPLPAVMLAGPPCGAALVYAYGASGGPDALPAVPEPHHGWLCGAVLALSVPDARDDGGPDRTVAALLNFWDRARVGRASGRHRAALAVVVRRAAQPDARAALEGSGYDNLVRALEARFGHVEFFAQPGPALRWVCERVA